MGLPIDVYRAPDYPDTTNGGVSGTHSRLIVVNVSGPFDPRDDMPAVILVAGPRGCPIIVPAEYDPETKLWDTLRPGGVGPMHGGNIASSSDSRWHEAVRRLAVKNLPDGYEGIAPAIPTGVAIHDRFETAEQYRALSAD
jgi:hypothetical protein